MGHGPLRVVSRIATMAVLILPGLSAAAADPGDDPPRDVHDTAYRLYSRIAGVPPTPEEMETLKPLVAEGRLSDAAAIALESPYFYNVTLRNWAVRWTNEDQTSRAPLNDFAATVIGLIRDDRPMGELLTADILYVGDQTKAGGPLPPYSLADNKHYEALDARDASLKDVLVPVSQSQTTGLGVAAGVMTTRAFAEAYYQAGTNRRAVRYTFMNFLCHDLEAMHDTARPDYRVRRDVDRSPGGDSTLFRNRCAGCHAGMDGLGGAFAYVDFEGGKLVHTPGVVRPKMNINGGTFPEGFVTVDDSWINIWSEGTNARMGWKGKQKGKGLVSYGALLAESDGFARCMATQAFELMCLNSPESADDKSAVAEMANTFRAGGGRMKPVFAAAAAHCYSE